MNSPDPCIMKSTEASSWQECSFNDHLNTLEANNTNRPRPTHRLAASENND